jgi:hypothetical protein
VDIAVGRSRRSERSAGGRPHIRQIGHTADRNAGAPW